MRTPKKRRLTIVLISGLCLAAATGLMLAAFSSTLTYFLSPRQVEIKHPRVGMDFRLGGIVQAGTVHTDVKNGTPTTLFRVTDGRASVPVTYTGVLPDLFREGQGVVAIGAMTKGGTFAASEVLAKHGAAYMPRDVEQALKEAGKWNPRFGPPPPASEWNDMSVKGNNS